MGYFSYWIANLVTGVADANMDRAPLIVLTGQGSTERIHKERYL